MAQGPTWPARPGADVANQPQHPLLLSWGRRPGLGGEAAGHPRQAFCKGRTGAQRGTAACHSPRPLGAETGFKPVLTPDLRACGSWWSSSPKCPHWTGAHPAPTGQVRCSQAVPPPGPLTLMDCGLPVLSLITATYILGPCLQPGGACECGACDSCQHAEPDGGVRGAGEGQRVVSAAGRQGRGSGPGRGHAGGMGRVGGRPSSAPGLPLYGLMLC